MNEDQLYDAAEREMDLYRAEITRITAERDKAQADRNSARNVVAEILDCFGPSGSGHTARVGQVQIAKWRTRAGLTS